MRSSWFLTIGALVVLAGFSPAHAGSDRTGLLWTLNLREHGLTRDPTLPPEAMDAVHQLAFGSRGELVILGRPSRRGPILRVLAYVLDARTGKLLGQREWKTISEPFIAGTVTGNFAVNWEHGTVLYSAGLESEIRTSEIFVQMASPDGRRLAAQHIVNGRNMWIGFDSESLEVDGTSYLSGVAPSISATGVAEAIYPPEGGHPVRIRNQAGDQVDFRPDCKAVNPFFLSDLALAVIGCGQFTIIDTAGHPLLSGRAQLGHDYFSAARDGSRVVLNEARFAGGGHGALRDEVFTVFDLPEGHPVFTVRNKELHGEDLARSGAALSPDGSLLAINSWGIVKVFRLPPAPIRPGQGS